MNNNNNPFGIKQSQEQVQSEAPQSQLVLPYQFAGDLTKDSTTPSVKNITRCKCINLSAVSITNFSEGQEGQEIIVLGDGNTSVEDGPFITPGGGTHLLEPNYLYRFVLTDVGDGNLVWIEFNYGGTSASSGGGGGGTIGTPSVPTGDVAPPETISFLVPAAASGVWSTGEASIRKKAILFKISADQDSIVRLYFNAALRDSDTALGRLPTTNPGPGIILAEVGLGLANLHAQFMSPVPIIYNADNPFTDIIYWAVKQTSGLVNPVNVNLYILPLET